MKKKKTVKVNQDANSDHVKVYFFSSLFPGNGVIALFKCFKREKIV